MDLKVTSIQELENIDVTKYGDNPESLVQLAKQLQNYQKYEKAIEVLEQALKFSIKNNGDNEEALDCAKFYHNYGVSILRKIMENNNELFQNTVEETKKSKSENKKKENEVNETNSIENKTSSPAKKAAEHLTKSNTKTETDTEATNDDNDIKINDVVTDKGNLNDNTYVGENVEEEATNENEVENVEEEVSEEDEEISFLNLSVADKIYRKNLEKYDNIPNNELPEEVKKLYSERANNLLSLGELEIHKSDYQSAVDYFNQALLIRKKIDHKFSREIAEIYFLLSGAYDYDIEKSVACYYKTKLIMEYHLKNELSKLSFRKPESWEENINENMNIDFETIDEKDIKLDRQVLHTTFGDTEAVLELRDILSELFEKIEDSLIDFNKFKSCLNAFKEKQKEPLSPVFNSNFDATKVIDISQTNLIRKKPRDDTKKEESASKKTKENDLNNCVEEKASK